MCLSFVSKKELWLNIHLKKKYGLILIILTIRWEGEKKDLESLITYF